MKLHVHLLLKENYFLAHYRQRVRVVAPRKVQASVTFYALVPRNASQTILLKLSNTTRLKELHTVTAVKRDELGLSLLFERLQGQP